MAKKDPAPKQNPGFFSSFPPTTTGSNADVKVTPKPAAKAEKTPAQKAAATKAKNKRAAAKAEKAAEPSDEPSGITSTGSASKPTPDEVAADQGRNLPRPPAEAEAARLAADAPVVNELVVAETPDPAANVDGIFDPGTTLGTITVNPGIKDPGSTLDS